MEVRITMSSVAITRAVSAEHGSLWSPEPQVSVVCSSALSTAVLLLLVPLIHWEGKGSSSYNANLLACFLSVFHYFSKAYVQSCKGTSVYFDKRKEIVRIKLR